MDHGLPEEIMEGDDVDRQNSWSERLQFVTISFLMTQLTCLLFNDWQCLREWTAGEHYEQDARAVSQDQDLLIDDPFKLTDEDLQPSSVHQGAGHNYGDEYPSM